MIYDAENRLTYLGDGKTTEFAITFDFLEKTDIVCVIVDEDGNEETLAGDYFVDLDKSTVTYPGYPPGEEPPETERPQALPDGAKLVIYRSILITQESSLGDKWPFNVIEDALDKLTMICQDLFYSAKRMLKLPAGAGDDVDPTLPAPSANMGFYWDESGTKLVAGLNPKAATEAAASSAAKAAASEAAAQTSETNAKASETNAAESEAASKASEEAAKVSEDASKANAESAAKSAEAAAGSETQAAESEKNALASKEAAETAAELAKADRTASEAAKESAAESAAAAEKSKEDIASAEASAKESAEEAAEAAKHAGGAKLSTLTIPKTGWAETEEGDYELGVTCDSAATDLFPVVAIHRTSLSVAGAAGISPAVEAGDGVLIFHAQEIPTEDMTASVAMILHSNGWTQDTLPVSTEETLGAIKIGDGLDITEDGTASVDGAEISATDEEAEEMLDEVFGVTGV